ncbi:MAG: sigma 54-interacting transcriptional regulator, partial [Albidovulum sp.]
AVNERRTVDVMLRRNDGRAILAVPRRIGAASQPGIGVMVVLRDLNGLDYRRNRANGQSTVARMPFLAENRTRADFGTQRRLSPDLHRILSRGERAMVQGTRILITGESGVGKTELAKYLHNSVADASDPFVVVNCASSSDALFAGAMFGADAAGDRGQYQGLIEQSEGGTLFLDEVGEIPMSAQALLLRFLEDGLITRLAGGQHRVVNVRVIAATNRDLRQLVRDGKFRADLYYRLAVVPLHVPPLRVMPALADHLITRFLQTINQRRQTPMLIPQRLRDRLLDYGYPGNIRELSNIIQKLAIFMEDSEDLEEVMGDLLSPIDIPGLDGALAGFAPGAASFDLKTEVRRYERILIDKAIRVHGSKRKAANALGVDIGTIVRKTAEPSEATTMAKEDQTNMGDHGK